MKISRFFRRSSLGALLAASASGAGAHEVFYDQFDWGTTSDLATALWATGGTNASYLPDLPMGALEGSLQLRANGASSALSTQSLASAFPGRDYQIYAHVRMTTFPAGTAEANAEIAIRSTGTDGYLITLDGGQDLIRLRRQGGGYTDLVPSASATINPGDDFYISFTSTGTNPVVLQATVSRTADFAEPLFDATTSEATWRPAGDKVQLRGYTASGAYQFDYDYFAIGQPAFPHPVSVWSRPGRTGAVPEPVARKVTILTSYDVTPEGVILHSGAQRVAVVPRLDRTVRVDFLPDGVAAPPASWTVTRTDWPTIPFTVAGGDPIKIESAGWRVDVSRNPMRLTFRRPDGTEILREADDLPLTAPDAARREAFILEPGESIYGLGEHSVGSGSHLDRRGYRFAIDNDHQPPAYLIWPFWTSSRNCGVYIDNPGMGYIDFGLTTSGRIQYDSAAGEVSYYVFFGNSMYDVQDQYTQVTGRPVLAPRWGLGNLQSRYAYSSFTEMQTTVDGFRSRHIPVEALIMDLYWFGKPTMGNLDFEATTNWANPAAGTAALHARNIKLIPITEPQISSLSYNVGEVTAQKLVGLTAAGAPMAGTALTWITSGPVYLFDFTNPAARQWWIGKHDKLIKTYGFDGFWQDLNEPEGLPSGMQFAAGSATLVHNIQALEMNRTLNEAMALHRPGARTFIMSRSGFAGMQKYGASVWSGDVDSSWAHLKAQPAIGLSMNLAGEPYWNSDIGGFHNTPTSELYMRWAQFGFFCPVYRPHGSQGSFREPWLFGSTVEAAVGDLLRLRSRLVPYYYTVGRQAYDTGAPIMRALLLDWPQDPVARAVDNQFLYGPSLMAAPVTTQGATTRSVYLPDGIWYDWFTDEKLVGGRTVIRNTPLTSFPVLVRAPAIIPLGPEMETIDGVPLTDPTLRLYLPAESTEAHGELYEDDGQTLAYQTGAYVKTNFHARRLDHASLTIDIAPTGAGYPQFPAARPWRIEWIDADEPTAVGVDGEVVAHAANLTALDALPAGWTYDSASGRAIVKLPSALTMQPRQVQMNLMGPVPDRWEFY